MKMSVSELLDRVYAPLGEFEKAYFYHKQHIALRDSMTDVDKQKKLAKMTTSFEWEKKMLATEKENMQRAAVAQKDLRTQRIIIYGGGFLLVCIAGLTVFAFRRWKITKRQKQIIEVQKHLVDEKNKEITDSIMYARRIQKALITSEKYIARNLRRLNL